VTEQWCYDAFERIIHLLDRTHKQMTDLTAATAQVAATLATIANAVAVIQADAAALAVAHQADDTQGVADLVAKLKAGTDTLAATFTVAPVAPVAAPVTPVAASAAAPTP
jgi:hypothetical protein